MFLAMSMSIAFLLGWVSQTLGLCLVLAIKRLLLKKSMLFLTLASAGIIGMTLSPLYRQLGFDYPFYFPNQSLVIIFMGGLTFGIGAALNNGCNVGSVTRLTRGDSSMIITILGWIIGEIIWHKLTQSTASKQLTQPLMISDSRFFIGVFIIALPATLLLIKKRERRIWQYTTLLGILASGLFIIEPHWTPSSYVYDLSQLVLANQSVDKTRSLTVLALLLGMVAQSIYIKSFELKGFDFLTALHHLCAGVLMGIGAIMALGGNDSQILLAFPTLTLQASVALVSMCLGIWIVLTLRTFLKQGE